MRRSFRLNEYKVLGYRLLLVYLFYFISRILFYVYNSHLIEVNSVTEFLQLSYHGLAFDTTAILYVNSLFVLFSIFPLFVNTKERFQNFLFYLYFSTNLIAYATNFIDFIYYRYTFGRSTVTITDSIAHESNKTLLFLNFLVNYWHVFLLFFITALAWIYLYKKVKVVHHEISSKIKYSLTSVIGVLFISTLCVGGIRGDFKKSTRPINIIDSSRYVKNVAQADIVLNTPFAIMRTLFTNAYKKENYVSQRTIDTLLVPIKQYKNNPKTKPNVVIMILESNAKEYYGCLNKDMKIKNYESFTPFMDSLAQHSLTFSNAYSNGFKSIHAMSSILAGIPSFKDAFTSSPYAKQKTESLVTILKGQGYSTSFFHGAPNGSMGFLGYSNILGIDRYYGKNEYNNDEDFDGVWGIWDEPFFQYFNKKLSEQKQPFMSTLFSVSSHEPYQIPEKYKGKFPEGHVAIHKCIGYTDHALKQFFKEAQKQPWFKNTIFVMVGDHGNLVWYDEYKKEFNRNAVAMMIYDPSGKYKGDYKDFAQQIDIYPTILDMIGYDKPFRSWGRSLISDKNISPFVMRYSANVFQLMSGNYICCFDGKKAVGFYDKNDKGMEHNLIAHRNTEMDLLETRCKAFIQDYMERIIDKKLTFK